MVAQKLENNNKADKREKIELNGDIISESPKSLSECSNEPYFKNNVYNSGRINEVKNIESHRSLQR